MVHPLKITYKREGAALTVATPSDLDSALEQLLAEYAGNPMAAEIVLADDRWGPGLDLGIRPGAGALRYSGPDSYEASYSRNVQTPAIDVVWPPSEHAVTLSYDYMGHEREFPADAELPLDTIRQALAEFAETGRRPSCIHWREPNRNGTVADPG